MNDQLLHALYSEGQRSGIWPKRDVTRRKIDEGSRIIYIMYRET